MHDTFDLDSFSAVIREKIISGENPTSIRKYIRHERNLGKTQGNDYYNKIDKSLTKKERAAIPRVEVETVNVEGFQDYGDTAVAEIKGISTLEGLIEAARVDLEVWEMVKSAVSVYRGNFSVRAEFRKRVEELDFKKIKEEIKSELSKISPKVARIKYQSVKQENLLELAIYDTHFGKRTVDQDPRFSSLEASQELFKSTVVELVDRALKFNNFSRILFPISNDYLNIDSSKNVTYGGTPQDTDLSFSTIFKEGRKLLVWAIDYLKQFAPVDVVYIPSNHDLDSMFHMSDAIECWYHNDPNVTIDNSDKPRKYYLFGDDIVIGMSHGDKAGKKLPALASIECPQWSARKHRELRKGHFHSEAALIIEEAGCIIRTIPSLSGLDNWHQGEGYVGSKQRSQAFIWGEKSGLNTIIYSTSVN